MQCLHRRGSHILRRGTCPSTFESGGAQRVTATGHCSYKIPCIILLAGLTVVHICICYRKATTFYFDCDRYCRSTELSEFKWWCKSPANRSCSFSEVVTSHTRNVSISGTKFLCFASMVEKAHKINCWAAKT